MCDTQVQAEQLAVLLHGDAENAAGSISTINAKDERGNACGLADVVYLRAGPMLRPFAAAVRRSRSSLSW
jgi:hypothetical protein